VIHDFTSRERKNLRDENRRSGRSPEKTAGAPSTKPITPPIHCQSVPTISPELDVDQKTSFSPFFRPSLDLDHIDILAFSSRLNRQVGGLAGDSREARSFVA